MWSYTLGRLGLWFEGLLGKSSDPIFSIGVVHLPAQQRILERNQCNGRLRQPVRQCLPPPYFLLLPVF